MSAIASPQILIPIDDSSRVGEARRTAMHLARANCMGAEDVERVGLICTEIGTNIIKHAGEGTIFLRWMPEAPGVEVLAFDRGPGIGDLGRLRADSQSTCGTLGNGLGGIFRLSDVHDLHTAPGKGTTVLSRVHPRGQVPHTGGFDFGVISTPVHGGEVCGDGWAVDLCESPICVVIDGLGHGPHAAAAARAAEGLIYEVGERAPNLIMDRLHRGLGHTRGAVAAAIRIEPTRRSATAAGVGNIAVRVVGESAAVRLASYPGTLGHHVRHCQALSAEWDGNAVVVMHSDGLSQKWLPQANPGMWGRHPGVIAALLFRDHANPADDATVAVIARRQRN